jgi:hypothetical protein
MEEIDIAVHAAGGGGAERAGGHARRGLGGAGVVDGVVLEVGRQVALAVEDFLEFGVGDVARDDDGPGERDGRW